MTDSSYKVSFDDAIRNVTALDDIPLPDDVPCIQAVNSAVKYQIDFDTHFGDSGAFRIAHARYPEEAQVQSQLHKLLEAGRDYAIMLYTWRSCSRALPPIKSNEQPYRIQIYEKTVDILEPYVAKLREFKMFQQLAIDRFCEEVQRLCHEKKREDFVSSAYLLSLGRLLCMFAQLDEMKNMKASMKNDHSHYKRATQFLRNLDRESMHESQVLSLFLAEQNVIRDRLREQLGKIPGHEDLLADIVNTALTMYEGRTFVLPEEKHGLVLMAAFGLHLLEATGTSPGNSGVGNSGSGSSNSNTPGKQAARKRLSLSRLDKVLKECQVVRLFGDMSICPFNYVRSAPNYEASKWPECNNAGRLSGQGVLLDHLPRFRDEYAGLTAELAWHTNLVTTRESGRSKLENRELYHLMLRALQLLSGWTVQVLDTYTWKLAHCTDAHQNPGCPRDAEDYEKAVRYNYSGPERLALVEVVAMVKAVQAQMTRLDASYSEGVRQSVYLELQNFVQVGLGEPYRRATKSAGKRGGGSLLSWLIDSMRAVCQDRPGQVVPVNSSTSRSPSSSTVGSSSNTDSIHQSAAVTDAAAAAGIRARDVAPSSTQLYLVRTTVESLIASRPGAPKNALRKELDSASIALLENFFRTSFYWPYLLNLSDTVSKCCDMSQFWFREFFLELTNGARVQFPIEMSLPWILTEHVLAPPLPPPAAGSSTNTTAVASSLESPVELLLYPLDLYNDAAHCALVTFRRRFLYDELEAEANLAFDQLVFRLAERLFCHYKALAASVLVDKRYRVQAARLGLDLGSAGAGAGSARFAVLLRQRQVHLLGRNIDLNRLLTQRVNRAVLTSLDTAISRFRSSDITGVIELEALIECNRLCHRMLAEHLDLDDFDSLLKEANHSVKSHLGCIAQHVFWEINYDLSHNYCYNDATNRFVLTAVPFGEKLLRDNAPQVGPEYAWGSKALNAGMDSVFSLYRGFVGNAHVRVMCRLLGYQGVYVVVAELMKICESMIKTNLRGITRRLLQVMPTELRPPRLGQSSDQVFSEYYRQLEGVYQLAALSTDMCQAFREFGNIVLFILMLEQNLTVLESSDLKHAAAFTGVLPRPFIEPGPLNGGGGGGTMKRVASVAAGGSGTVGAASTSVTGDAMKEAAKKMEYKYSVLNVAKIVTRLGTPEQAQLAHDNEVLTKERLCCGLVMFEQVLRNLQEYLRCPDPANEQQQHQNHPHELDPSNSGSGNIWHGRRPNNEVMEVHECSEFHRVWSAVQFVFCTPRGENEFSIEELFGEGLNWAGCTIIALLGQQRRFEALDIGWHLMRVQRSDQKIDCLENVSLDRLSQRIRRFNILNSQIFATLNRYLCPVDRYSALYEAVRHFPTPMYQVSSVVPAATATQ